MAYTSSTLSLANQPIVDRKRWYYTTADGSSVWSGSSYISDGVAKGMSANDLVEIVNTLTSLPPVVAISRVISVSSLSSGGATISSGINLSS